MLYTHEIQEYSLCITRVLLVVFFVPDSIDLLGTILTIEVTTLGFNIAK